LKALVSLEILNLCRSNLFLDGVLVVNNDYPQGATQRCGTAAVFLQAGNHSLYVEGWSNTAALSISATFNGFDTLRSAVVIPGFWQCDPSGPGVTGMSFTICGYKADNSINLGNVLDLFTYYNQVRTEPAM
jgi:hypothetical protein